MISARAALSVLLLGLVSGCSTPSRSAPASPVAAADPASLFLEAWTLARDNFYDPALNGVDWNAVRDELLPAARAADSPASLSRVINQALDRLHASHTRHYTPHEREYHELLDIFHPPPDGIPADLSAAIPAGPVTYVGIGLVTERIADRLFVSDVYPGCPADAAGVHVGDELVGIESAPWSDVDAFRDREGLPTRLQVRRARDADPLTLTVAPTRLQPCRYFLDSIERSARLIQQEGRSVGYIRVRSYANSDFHDKVVELVRTRFANADALVLDLRGPWGGANPEYLSLFSPLTPDYEFKTRTGEWSTTMLSWRRPVALVVDSGTRSGKELLAYAFRVHKIGPIVGSTTAGAVLGGRPFVLSDGSILYLAVNDVRVGGERLEGVGVAPTMPVERALPYADGRDPLIDAAVRAVLDVQP